MPAALLRRLSRLDIRCVNANYAAALHQCSDFNLGASPKLIAAAAIARGHSRCRRTVTNLHTRVNGHTSWLERNYVL